MGDTLQGFALSSYNAKPTLPPCRRAICLTTLRCVRDAAFTFIAMDCVHRHDDLTHGKRSQRRGHRRRLWLSVAGCAMHGDRDTANGMRARRPSRLARVSVACDSIFVL